jgi:hypothetical protein
MKHLTIIIIIKSGNNLGRTNRLISFDMTGTIWKKK